ncbi:DUF6880 family protein [uncultured Sphingomonas sp.]|uniref:DUF6880 family protein n=1 Tax=uncultured Sphingomonas sp. TaxID=158754 RepID=UPI0035CAE241
MPAKTLNAKNLEALGSAKLAELLIEVSTGNAVAQRRLRLELAGNAGPEEAAREIGKRLAAISRSKTYVDWQKVKPLMVDLTAQRAAILAKVAPTDPRTAFQLVWRLVSCADSVFARSGDGSGRLADIFRGATRELGALAQAGRIDPDTLVELTFEAVCDNGYGQWDGLIEILAPALGPRGLDMLRDRTTAWQSEPLATPAPSERVVVGWGLKGPMYADKMEATRRRRTATHILQQLADQRGDVDGYIAQFDDAARTAPVVAAQIARRLLAASRVDDAWAALERVDYDNRRLPSIEWEQARLDTLEALGRADDAQAFRWERFEATLDATHLREHLRRLPDFDDFEAEQRALTYALGHRDIHEALAFLTGWPALDQASRLALARASELNGDLYELLGPAADTLSERHPLAASLLLRAMIDFTLGKARSSRYKHAARHLSEAEGLATRIEDFGTALSHDDYIRCLRNDHGRKAGFWHAVADEAGS